MVLSRLLTHLHVLSRAQAVTLICYIEHFSFDETKLLSTVHFSTAWQSVEKSLENAKAFVVQAEWLILVRKDSDEEILSLPEATSQLNAISFDADKYWAWMGRCSPSLRAADRTTGAAISKVLSSALPEPQQLDEFQFRIRLAECDSYPANFVWDYPRPTHSAILHGLQQPCLASRAKSTHQQRRHGT